MTWTLNAHPCLMWTGGGSMETRRLTSGLPGFMAIQTDLEPGGREIREDGSCAGADINVFSGHINNAPLTPSILCTFYQ